MATNEQERDWAPAFPFGEISRSVAVWHSLGRSQAGQINGGPALSFERDSGDFTLLKFV